MSIFRTLSTSQDTAFLLLESTSQYNTFDMNVDTISITNIGTTSVNVDLHLHPNAGSDHTVMKANIPAGVTLIYDTPFSFLHTSKLRITPDNNNELNITIN